MLRDAMTILLSSVIAVGGGAASAWYALESAEGVGALTVRGWTAYPNAGSPDADPYSKARVAREAELPLGRAEGIAFTTGRDSGGEPLRLSCTYRVEGQVPSARFWTLHVTGAGVARAAALPSQALMRESDGSVVLTASRHPSPGNWLALSGDGTMALVLTLYDTPVASNEDIAGTELPQVLRVGCDG
nr:DUF1214 domain-containing protein [Mesorhizobium australicum]